MLFVLKKNNYITGRQIISQLNLKIMCVNFKLTFVIKFIEENIELVTFSKKRTNIHIQQVRLKLF